MFAPQFRRRLVALSLACLAPFGARAADLWDVWQLALDNDAAYRAAAFTYEAAKQGPRLARSALLPDINVSKAKTEFHSFTNEKTESGVSEADLNLSIFNAPDIAALKQAKLERHRAELAYTDARHDLIVRTATAYFDLLAANDAHEVARRHKIAIKRQMDFAAERLQVGLGTQTDLLDAKARFLQASAELIESRTRISNALLKLREIVGADAAFSAESPAALAQDAPLEAPQPNDLQHWIERAAAGNLQVRRAVLAAEIAKRELRKQQLARLPSVRLNVTRCLDDADDEGCVGVQEDYILSATMPLFHGGRLGANSRRAGAQYNAARERLKQQKRLAESSTTAAFLAVTDGISRVNALQQAVVAGEGALEAKEEGFRVGITTNLDVLDAQRDLARSRTDYLRARYDYILAVLRLARTGGELDEDAVMRVNAWLDA